jgi:hypothetical protein
LPSQTGVHSPEHVGTPSALSVQLSPFS